MQLLIANPYPLNTSNGNTTTAKRIAHLLSKSGVNTSVVHTDTPPAADALINLHATKTYPAARHFKTQYPRAKLITLLTGTDINHDLPNHHPDILPALHLADHLIIPHAQSLQNIPTEFHHKTSIVPASILIPEIAEISPPPIPAIILPSHLREVKNPFLLNRALALIPDLPLHAYTLGAELEPGLAQQARHYETIDPRFHYLGNTPHPETLAYIKHATLTLNTSHQEGGPNTIAESITLDTPVLASKIPGNIGILDTNYPGLFTPNDPRSLANLIQKSLTNPAFYQTLKSQTTHIAPRFNPRNETSAWLHILLQS